MTIREMEQLTAHYDHYFQQTTDGVFHMPEGITPHIDLMLYDPTDTYPFWKLVTMGASDYRMPKAKQTLGDRNEYMLFIPPDENMQDEDTLRWYITTLMEIALYAPSSKTHITYGHSMEWGAEDGSDIVGAYVEMPQIIGSTGILRCKLGFLKQVICLQPVLLTCSELNRLLTIGPQQFSNYLYPEEDAPSHFLSERCRTARF